MNPNGCANNTQLTGAAVLFAPQSQSAGTPLTAGSSIGFGGTTNVLLTPTSGLSIPIIVNIGNILTVTPNGSATFDGPITGGTANTSTGVAADVPGFNSNDLGPSNSLGVSVATDNGVPVAAETLTVTNTNPANSPLPFSLAVSTLAGTPTQTGLTGNALANATATCSGGSGAATGPTSATLASTITSTGISSGWFTATPNQGTFGSGASAATISFSVVPAVWATLPTLPAGCTYTANVSVSATNVAAGSTPQAFTLSFIKMGQPVTTTVPGGPGATVALLANVGSGLVNSAAYTVTVPSTTPIDNGLASFTADARTDAIAGTSYPGYAYPTDGGSNPFTFDVSTPNGTPVGGANPLSWLTITPSNGSTGQVITINANTANLTPSPTQPTVNNACPVAGTVLINAGNASSQACATPYTGRVRIRNGVNGNDTFSGQNPVEYEVTFVVVAAPAIILNPTSVQFSFTGGGALTNSSTVSAKSTSSTVNLPYTLTILSANGPGCTQPNWLTFTPGTGIATAAGDTFSVNANVTGCTGTTLTGDVHVHSATAAVEDFDIPVNVTLVTPVITANPGSLLPFVYTINGTTPTAETTLVTTNPSGLTVTATPSSTGNWLSSSLVGGVLTVSVNPTGLAASGTPYAGSVTLSTPGAANVIIPVSLTVNPSSISPSPTSISATYTLSAPNPPNQTITLVTIPTGLAVSASASSTGNWLSASVTGSSVTVGFNPSGTGLAANTNPYTGTITLTAANGVTASVPVSLLVSAATITSSPAILAFSSQLGAPAPPSQSLAITTNPTGSLVAAHTSVTTPAGGTWLSASVTQQNGLNPTTVTVTVSPTGLASGTTYQGSVTLSATGASNIVIPVSYTVSNSGVTATPSTLSFTGTLGFPQPAAQTVNAVTNPSGLTITATPATNSGGIWLFASVNGGVVTVTANTTGLAANTYTGSVTLNAVGSNPANPLVIPVTFTVLPTPVIIVGPPTSISATATVNGPAPGQQQILITVTNAASPLSVSTSYVSPAVPSVNWLSSTLSTTTATSAATLTETFTTAGLAAGTYTALVTITSPNLATVTVPVSLVVTSQPVLTSSPTSLAPFNFTIGGSTAAVCQTVNISTPGSPNLTLSPSVTPSGTWLSFTQSGGGTPANVTVCASPCGPRGEYL